MTKSIEELARESEFRELERESMISEAVNRAIMYEWNMKRSEECEREGDGVNAIGFKINAYKYL